MTTLLVTNDFGPRIGGIETFCAAVCSYLDDDVVVLTAEQVGAASFDAALRFPVVRIPGPILPTPAVSRRAIDLMHAYQCTHVVFGAAAPLGLLAPTLRRAGAERIVALSHGHEVWWARIPGTASLLRQIADNVDVFTTVSAYTESAIGSVLSAPGRQRLLRLPPPVDTDLFRPRPGGISSPLAVAAGRFVPQKGFLTLLEAWRIVVDAIGGKAGTLRLIGDGPQRDALQQRVRRYGLASRVEFVGPMAHSDLPTHLAEASVFALPVRSMLAGLYSEGFGVVFAEAAACERPIIVGRSGGASETVIPGSTGHLIDPRKPQELSEALIHLLTDPDVANEWGAAGRHHILSLCSSHVLRSRFLQAMRISDD